LFKMSERSFNVTTSERRDYTQETVGFTAQFLYSYFHIYIELTEIKSCRLYKLMRSMSTENKKEERKSVCHNFLATLYCRYRIIPTLKMYADL
jgi:hypothetical protein